jgi:hypothetical protein
MHPELQGPRWFFISLHFLNIYSKTILARCSDNHLLALKMPKLVSTAFRKPQ